MINIENELFTIVATELRTQFDGIMVYGEEQKIPAIFPVVTIEEKDNSIVQYTQTYTGSENHDQLLYEVNVYSNKTTGKKTEAKSIQSVVDDKMRELGFTRTFCQPIKNLDDVSIYRITSRYTAIISQNKTIYGR